MAALLRSLMGGASRPLIIHSFSLQSVQLHESSLSYSRALYAHNLSALYAKGKCVFHDWLASSFGMLLAVTLVPKRGLYKKNSP